MGSKGCTAILNNQTLTLRVGSPVTAQQLLAAQRAPHVKMQGRHLVLKGPLGPVLKGPLGPPEAVVRSPTTQEICKCFLCMYLLHK